MAIHPEARRPRYGWLFKGINSFLTSACLISLLVTFKEIVVPICKHKAVCLQSANLGSVERDGWLMNIYRGRMPFVQTGAND
jgi:hypothetical protein